MITSTNGALVAILFLFILVFSNTLAVCQSMHEIPHAPGSRSGPRYPPPHSLPGSPGGHNESFWDDIKPLVVLAGLGLLALLVWLILVFLFLLLGTDEDDAKGLAAMALCFSILGVGIFFGYREQRAEKAEHLSKMAKEKHNENWSLCGPSNASQVRIDSCSKLIDAGYKTNEDLAVAFGNRCSAYFDQDRYAFAMDDCNEAIRLKPDFLEALNIRAMIRFKQEEYDDAIKDLNASIHLKQTAEEFCNRGMAYAMKGDNQRAFEDFSESIRMRPNFTAFHGRGRLYAVMGQNDRALQDFNESIRLKPEAITFGTRGNVYLTMGDSDRAIQDYGEYIRLNPDDAGGFLYRGFANFSIAHFREAAADFERSFQLKYQVDTILWLHISRLRSGENDPDIELRATGFDNTGWPGPIVKFYVGQLSASGLMDAAGDADSRGLMARRCQANFFIGEEALLQQNLSDALMRFRGARDGCRVSFASYWGETFADYSEALAELKHLDNNTR
jgi:lipoprotein NlpI